MPDAPDNLIRRYRDEYLKLRKWADDHDRVIIGPIRLEKNPKTDQFHVTADTAPVNTVKILGLARVEELARQAKEGIIT